MKVGVVGYGFVGSTVANTFYKLGHEVHVSDPYKKVPSELGNNTLLEVKECPIIFIALPTVPTSDGKQMDLTPFFKVLKELEGSKSLIIIKSTLLPGTTRSFAIRFKLENLCFMPEFLTERTAMVDFMCPDRIVLGSVGRIDPRLFLNLFSKFDCPKIVTSSETAELLKFASNTFFATKVTYANFMYDVAEHYEVDWEEIKKILYLDKRIGNDHLTVYEKNRGFGGHCLPKDLYQLTEELKPHLDVEFFESILKENRKMRPNKKDWEA